MAFYICMKLECIGWVQITAFGFELWENMVLYCAVSHCRCPGLPATLNGRQQGWIVIGWPEAPLLGGCGVAVFGHGHSQKQTIYPLLRGATEKSWKISRREATKAFSLQHNANSCHACSLPNPRHKDTIHSYANTYSLETLLQSIEVKNIPVNYDKWQLKHDFTSWNFLLHFDWQYSMFMFVLLPKRLTDTAFKTKHLKHLQKCRTSPWESASLLEQDVKCLWYFYLSICEMDFNLELV